MRLCWKASLFKILAATALVVVPAGGFAASCTSQAELTPQDRGTLAGVGERLSTAFVQQDLSTLQNALLPAMASQWSGIQGVAEQAAPLVKGGKPQLRNIYLLDASTLSAPSDTQFFCSSANGALTVTVNMRALPPGKYALVLADAAGAQLAGQMALILVWDTTSSSPEWRLGGLSARQGIFDEHDGV